MLKMQVKVGLKRFAKSHLTLGNKESAIVQCFGLTQNPSNRNYLLVMMVLDMNLREYLQQNYNQLTWKERIRITFEIIDKLYWIHEKNSIHRDLHSGNILYSQFNDSWFISDLGFCGPADKPSTSIYGNLPYIAPEVINGKGYTYKSDIYSIAMLMWEISFGQPPFMNYEHDCILAINIIDGIRPKIISEIPSEYKSLMEQCWDANPLKRPDINTLYNKMNEIMSYYRNNPNELPQLIAKIDKEKINNMSSKLFTSKIHNFENLPEPKNATEEEQNAFYITRSYDFSISGNTSNHSKSSNQYKSINFKDDDSKESSRLFKKLKMENADIQNDYKREIMQQRSNISIDDEVQNNPNLHSEEKDKQETPDGDLPELTNEIIKYFKNDFSTLYSCILVNKFWCRLVIPLLWEDPFSIPTQNYRLPTNFTLFNYPSFIKCLNIQNICSSIKKWTKISVMKYNRKKLENLVYRSLFKVFIENEGNLLSFKVVIDIDSDCRDLMKI
ncbi:kinase-like protein [Rhizophagus irregularis]|nr:kinase-like protein [Rhizophagus irregularis]